MENCQSLLIVEDDPPLRDLMKLALERLDCEILVARNGEEALTIIEKHHPPLVVVDILLPRMNGLELMAHLKEIQLLDQTKIIVTTGLGYREVVNKAMQAGATDFLVKPFDVDELLLRVQRALSLS